MIKNLVSVVMPTYNDEKYLPAAIDDILAQSYSNFELIIVDDGSTDNTAAILKRYAKRDSRIRLFKKENGGTGSAVNFGFKHARGEFGTWVSSDDNKTKDCLERMVEALKRNRDVEYVNAATYSRFLNSVFKPYEFLPNARRIWWDGLQHEGRMTGKTYIVDDWADVNRLQCFLGVCFMFTMRLKNEVGDYIEIPGEDFEMLMRMALKTRVAFIDAVLGSHNNPDDALSMQDRQCVMEANKLAGELYNKADHWHSKIPKIASFYWGSSKMSFLRYLAIRSFKKYNPSWSIHLYCPENVSDRGTWREHGDTHQRCDETDYKGADNYLEKLLSEIPVKVIKVDFSKTFITEHASEPHKSDLLGWKVLASMGGIWCDMDIIFFKPMTELNISPDVDTLVCYDNRNPHADGSPAAPIGFMGSLGGNAYFKNILLKSKKLFNRGADYQSIGCLAKKSVANSFDEAESKFFKNTFHNLGGNPVYAIDHTRLSDLWEANCFEQIKDMGIGIHWYGGAPISQKYNNLINHENWRDFDSTVSEVIKRVFDEE